MSYANATITERQSGRKLSSEGYSVDCRVLPGSTPGSSRPFLRKLKKAMMAGLAGEGEGGGAGKGRDSQNDETGRHAAPPPSLSPFERNLNFLASDSIVEERD